MWNYNFLFLLVVYDNKKLVMRKIFVIILFLSGCGTFEAPSFEAQSVGHEIWNDLLADHVSDDGWVDYKGFKRDTIALQKYLDLLSRNPPNATMWTKEEQLAYWINVYNAFTVKLIVDNYPLKSITELHPKPYFPMINTVWHREFFKIGESPTNLDAIEHKILRKKFDEPRIHFAIVCASYSCPKLRNEAFVGEKIEAQLTGQAISFINDSKRNIIHKDKVALSKIFKWFKGDFTKNGSLVSFLNKYSKVEIDENASVSHMKYDWSLNEK